MTAGYVCAPYLHNHNSVELKDSWSHSRNIEDMFFVTATFSSDSKPYFPSSANHYLLAKFKDRTKIEKEIVKFQQESPSFVFGINDDIVVLEVSSEKGHQSDNKYCERTRRDVGRKGITMTNLVSLSVLEKLK